MIWSTGSVNYFSSTCKRVFDSYFEERGFKECKSQESGPVTYFHKGKMIFVTFDFADELFPRCFPIVAIGFYKGRPQTAVNTSNVIPLGYGIEEVEGKDDYWNWEFTNKAELELSLNRIRDDVIETYTKPLLSDPKILRDLIDKRKECEKREAEREEINQKRSKAEILFKSGKYRKAYGIYSDIGFSELTDVEKKRLELSKKFLASN